MPVPPDRPVPSPFPLVPVAALRQGDLLHLGGSAYTVVAGVQPAADGRAQVSVFDGYQARPRVSHGRGPTPSRSRTAASPHR